MPNSAVPNKGGFQPEGGSHLQCTAMSKRSGERCKGPAVLGSRTQKCRMHGGNSATGVAASNFKHGRHSKYLVPDLDAKYREALANPDLVAMTDHIALLEAQMQDILARSSVGEPVPVWGEWVEAFGELEDLIVQHGEEKDVLAALGKMHRLLDAGQKWDRTWDQVTGLTEHIRKLAEVEIKRKRELNMMIPVERVMVLMAAVGQSVKRNCKDHPDLIQAVFNDLAALQGANGRDLVPIGNGRPVIDVDVEEGAKLVPDDLDLEAYSDSE